MSCTEAKNLVICRPHADQTHEGKRNVATNKLKQRWKEGKAAVNAWLSIPSGYAAEVVAQADWDSITVDLQHGIQDYHSMVACFQGFQNNPATPLVRVPWNEPGIIGKVLDAGAYGVICPMINTREEAEQLVTSMRYPPRGTRSNGPARVGLYGSGGSYQKTANEEILCLPMIETGKAVDNLEAILDVRGVDGVYIGPSDLGFSLGLEPKLDREEKQILSIYERLIKEINKRGQYAGIHCGSTAYATRMIDMGFRLTTIMNDYGLLLTAAKNAVSEMRKGSKLAAK